MSLSIQSLSYIHSDKEPLFQNLNFSLDSSAKTALVGNNGSGKSTLLRIIAGETLPSSGSIILPADGVFYVPQHFGQYNNQTIAQAMQIDDKLTALHNILKGDVEEKNFTVLNEHWTIEDDAIASLNEWGLNAFSLTQPIEPLSGGEKTKVFLASMKLHPYSVLLLDEPTNHLDYKSRTMLYEFIESTRNSMIVVSHDRMLLNVLPTIAELSDKGIIMYGGNYEFYKEQKEQQQIAALQRLEESEKQLKQARKIARETAERQQKHSSRGEKANMKKGVPKIVMGNLKSASELTSAKLKGIHSDKIDSLQSEVRKNRETLAPTTSLQTDFNSSSLYKGKILVTANDINFAYDSGKPLWKDSLSFEIRSGNRLCIEGGNGSGKTTLLRIITKQLTPTSGTLIQAENLNYVYLDQEYSLIRNELSILEQAEKFNDIPLPEHELKTILNRFLFPASTWDKPCSKLSGGEKMRLAFCCLMINNNTPDLFILDEPTNNLDIQSIEIITDTIKRYEGTVIAISHDKYFLKEIGVEKTINLHYSFS
ncbi:ABC-F family ATP-binding cassette domain-containing protein [Bacteroides sp. 519]|uniref:ABC-F family ATP-binding cassette domain-containing protein n=1 Tax=Bacteroides sp. 519 TaxID=2302937 RepID=UPI0013D14C29|nr:ABC-F family ATP-binding cassette domain-containing protein [Bacteroides sp. 519]NDV58297.1 ABC transporter ATP-binding protein [Bacteroides sp. 519]